MEHPPVCNEAGNEKFASLSFLLEDHRASTPRTHKLAIKGQPRRSLHNREYLPARKRRLAWQLSDGRHVASKFRVRRVTESRASTTIPFARCLWIERSGFSVSPRPDGTPGCSRVSIDPAPRDAAWLGLEIVSVAGV